jgi:hypothetical protein
MFFSLWTGCEPTKRTYELVCYFFLGLASETALLKPLGKAQVTRRCKKQAHQDHGHDRSVTHGDSYCAGLSSASRAALCDAFRCRNCQLGSPV